MTRLVDADKLEVHEQITPLGAGMYESTFVVYKDDIDAQPTIDAEPVRHGKWVPKYIRICGQDWASGMKCSECGEDALNAEGEEFLTDYCPACGARMDKE